MAIFEKICVASVFAGYLALVGLTVVLLVEPWRKGRLCWAASFIFAATAPSAAPWWPQTFAVPIHPTIETASGRCCAAPVFRPFWRGLLGRGT